MKLTDRELNELHSIYFADENVTLSESLVSKFVGFGMVKVVESADGNLAFLTPAGRAAFAQGGWYE